MTAITSEVLAKCPPNYATMFRNRVAKTPDAIAFTYPDMSVPEGDAEPWLTLTWRQVSAQADQLGAGMIALGLQPEQRVAIASGTRIEWILADLGVTLATGATTTIYPNMHQDDIAHILNDSESVLAVLENATLVNKVLSVGAGVPQLRHIIVIDDAGVAIDADPRLMSWAQLASLGEQYLASHPSCLEQCLPAVGPESLATLIYTSGTTGRPKGVEIPHRCWTYESVCLDSLDFVHADDVVYLWLPFSHVFGRDLLSCQLTIGFIGAVDGRLDKLWDGLEASRPTILVAVPRFFEKIRAAVMTMYPTRGVKGQISRWAFAVGRESRPYRLAGRTLPRPARFRYALADKLVFSKLRKRLGGRMRFMISGSATLSSQVQEWFYSAGVTLIEGYGMTETSAITFLNMPVTPRFGTVGPTIPGIEARLARDGEVLVRGPIVAHGYHNLPQANAEAFTDGWFHTGDIGTFDADGYLTITDRKKDLIKTSNGKYVAPQEVEAAIMANVPYTSQAVVVGDGHPYVVALIFLDPEGLEKWGKNHGHEHDSYRELSQLPEIRASIDRFMRRVNARLERWETVKRYVLLDRELSQEAQELTPSLKVRRNVVLEHFADQIDELYKQTEHSDLVAMTVENRL